MQPTRIRASLVREDHSAAHMRATSPPLVAQRTNSTCASRREALTRLALAPIAVQTLLAGSPVALADEVAAPPPPPTPTTAPPKWKSFIERDFMFRYPPNDFRVALESDNMPVGMGQRRGDNPIRADVRAQKGTGQVTVVQQQAARLKQSLLQITDISQLGDLQQTARLLLPPGAVILAASIETFPQPPRDTGTVVGVIDRAPVNVYRYEVRLPASGQRAEVAAGVLLGRVLLLGASAAEEEWEEAGPKLKAVASTFKLLPK